MDAWKAFCNAGNATLMTVPSMNAMLDPRIVAASTIRWIVFGFELSGLIFSNSPVMSYRILPDRCFQCSVAV